MNEKTVKLIEQLADKLGTTAEHLWGVLVRQAPISALTDILSSALLVFAVWWSLRFVQRRTLETDESPADWTEEGAVVAWVVWGALSTIAMFIILFTLNDIVAGLLNPEYWALKQILH